MATIHPNYKYFLEAMANKKPARMPIYDHHLDVPFIEKATGEKLQWLLEGNTQELKLFFKQYVDFWEKCGYDIVTFERGIPLSFPGSGSLRGHIPGVIQSREDFEKYPFDSISDKFFEENGRYFELLSEELKHHEGMMAVGGPGYGIFETVQDITGYMNLCYMSYDDPELYEDLFSKVTEIFCVVWQRFVDNYADAYCVCRMGDDLGFQSGTLLPHKDIRHNILPGYKRIVDIVHKSGRPFLLHSCGRIFDVMEDILATGIDAKHSNEDAIAPFSTWVELYGDRICNLGGIDMNVLCLKSKEEIRRIVFKTIEDSIDHGGFALGSGNSIPDYVPVEGFFAMNKAANEFRSNQGV